MKYAHYFPGGIAEWLKAWWHNASHLDDIHKQNVYTFSEWTNCLNRSKKQIEISMERKFHFRCNHQNRTKY